MNLKKTILAAAVVAGLTASTAANAVLTNWYLDQDGAGAGSATNIISFLDITGGALISITPTPTTGNPAAFSFTEWGGVTSKSHDFGIDYADNQTAQLSSLFKATGNGTFGGSASFSGGILELYSLGLGAWGTAAGTFGVTGTPIATFEITGGGLQVNPDGTPIANGQVQIVAKATSMTAGYFFEDAAKTKDLSSLVSAPDGLLFGFATTNANYIPNGQLNPILASELLDYSGIPGGVVNDPTAGRFYVSNNGQYRLEVPEPSTLALAGLALVGLAARRRKNA
ncbi:PEP-CTERM sorting domain-containing protein [Rhodocyclus tenuis]|uniref:Type II secretory pathway pseudopilin PulG n=1 Tax=Rhodocyclus tenuis TaxID=1066 RepID=A0A840GB55_RHOTE|nr:PEP-CTERM sorting domain-containing protein [Rhodocyclus tenuis]MBB4247898.1 type II secretory pathway pseudopilin PulG [Rhodocyclus tenuis]MBK1679270.1 hypothetical protein [Rhodocyclus tenuis]